MKEAIHHYQIPEEPGRLRALGLALLVHLLLLGLLWFGVSWQSDTPVAVEAEIWNPVVREAAPLPPPPPEPVPEPPKPVAVVPPPTPVPVAEPVKAKLPDPDIALEKEKKRKQEKEDAERKKKEQLAEKKAREEEEQRKKLADAQEKEKKKLAELEKQKQIDEQKRKEQAAAEEKKRLAEEQQRKQEELATEQRARKRREEDLRRQMQLAGDGGSGDAEKSQGPRISGSYASKIGSLIKSNTSYPKTDSNSAVEYLVELLPDGSLRGEPKMVRSSGIPAFDLAVKRAIEKTAPFPPDPATGKVPSESFPISHRPKDSDNR